MPDKKSKHKEERKRKKSREHSNEKEEKKSRHEKRDEERRSRHERRGKEEKDFDRKMKEEKESERKVKEDKESDRRVKEEKDSERRTKDERSTDKKRKEHEPERKDKEEDCEVGLGQERLSLSIEETNKMREKLGLKPLKVDNKTTDGKETNEDGVKKEKKEDVHKPAINMADLKKTAMLKEKLAQMKEKRKHEETFSRIRPIACEKEEEEEEEEDVDSVLKWVAKSRKIEEAKKKQEEEEKLSKEFGVDKLVKKEFGGDKKYSSRELRGMKIEHDLDRFKEGKNVVLTLKDKGVLEENDDVLVNVNMVDDEAAEENTENRKKKLDYNPYEDLEYDEHGNPREESILNKYDDEIRGGKLKKSFTIGTQPNASGSSEDSSKRHMQSLVLPKPLLVSEYYTAQELELSGKPRKVRAKKVRKRMKLRADDLLDEVKTEVPSEVKSEVKKEVKVEQEEVDEDWDPYTDLSGVVVEEDGVALELEMAIKKASRINAIKSRTSHTSSEALVSVKEEPEEMEGIEMDLKDGIVLNSTTEYCRSLGEVSVSVDPSQAMPMHEDEEEDEEKKEEDNMKGWQSVDMEEGEVPVKEEVGFFWRYINVVVKRCMYNKIIFITPQHHFQIQDSLKTFRKPPKKTHPPTPGHSRVGRGADLEQGCWGGPDAGIQKGLS